MIGCAQSLMRYLISVKKMLKCVSQSLMMALAVWAAGCAHRPPLALNTIGPVSSSRAGLLGGSEGMLQVYSATETRDLGGITYYPHTPYLIYTPEGKKVKAVQNHAGDTDQKPMSVLLPPGRYLIYAMASGYGRVTVPVFIVGARLTAVYLERKGMPELQKAGVPELEWIRLPDGRVVGRRAEEDQKVNN